MRKGFVLVTALGIIAILTIAGTLATYTITNRTKGTVATKDSLIALKVAESGAEVALSKIKSGEIDCSGATCSPNTITGNVGSGKNYTVSLSKSGNIIGIISVGTFKSAQRKVVINIQPGKGTYYPFAINGTFDISGIDPTTWTDAKMGVVHIDPNVKSQLENAGFEVNEFPRLDLPRAADIDENLIFGPLDNGTCDIGSPTTDVYLSSLSNIEGKTICGKNIFVDTSLDVDNVKLLAENDIYVKDELGDKGIKTNWDVTLAAKNRVIFDDKIKFTGKTKGGYNLVVYAGNEIDANTFSQGVITVTGRQDATKTSSIFFITPGVINTDSTFLWDTGKTDVGANFVIWADKGVNVNDSSSIHLTGSCPNGHERNFAFLVADGDVHMKKLDFKHNTHPSGLTYDEIENYCNNGTALGIPTFYKDLYCELKKQIDSGSSSNINITEWKVY